ncbi:MAG: hypothetical protein WCR51_14345 [Planctomycetia bacterium]
MMSNSCWQYCRPAAGGKRGAGIAAAATKSGPADTMPAAAASAPRLPPDEPRRMRAIGRFGQLLGLGIPVFAVVLQLGGRLLPSQMLVMLVAAVCCFWIGRILEGYASR